MPENKQNNPAVSLTHNFPIIAGTGAKKTRFQEVPKYAEGLYNLGHDIYAWMVPNGSWGEANAGLIIGEGESLLVDTLWDVHYTRQMLDVMHTVMGAGSIKTVVNTHADGDHFFGNQLVSDAEIITSQAAYDEMQTVKPGAMLLLGCIGKLLSATRIFGGAAAGHWFQNMVAPYDFAAVEHTLPTRTFSGELTLDFGRREVRLIEVGPAHTLGDLMLHLPDARILFSGDILFIESTPVMWAGPIENMLAALDQILAMDVDLIVPGHGPLTGKSGARMVKDYWLFLQERVKVRQAAGQSAEEAAQRIVLSREYIEQPFANWNSPERIMINVHTLYRHMEGRTDHPQVPELLGILRKQALLAQQLPDAQPAVMRKR